MTPTEVTQAIRNGDVDHALPVITEALRARREYLDRQKAAENTLAMSRNTRVIITSDIRPKYLIDVLGKVGTGDYKPGYIWVDVDERYKHQMGRYGMHLHVPANCLSLAGEDEE